MLTFFVKVISFFLMWLTISNYFVFFFQHGGKAMLTFFVKVINFFFFFFALSLSLVIAMISPFENLLKFLLWLNNTWSTFGNVGLKKYIYRLWTSYSILCLLIIFVLTLLCQFLRELCWHLPLRFFIVHISLYLYSFSLGKFQSYIISYL